MKCSNEYRCRLTILNRSLHIHFLNNLNMSSKALSLFNNFQLINYWERERERWHVTLQSTITVANITCYITWSKKFIMRIGTSACIQRQSRWCLGVGVWGGGAPATFMICSLFYLLKKDKWITVQICMKNRQPATNLSFTTVSCMVLNHF